MHISPYFPIFHAGMMWADVGCETPRLKICFSEELPGLELEALCECLELEFSFFF